MTRDSIRLIALHPRIGKLGTSCHRHDDEGDVHHGDTEGGTLASEKDDKGRNEKEDTQTVTDRGVWEVGSSGIVLERSETAFTGPN